MKYRLLLTNRNNGDEAEVIVPARLPLEELSVKIKLELGLPLTDWGCHRFLAQGTTYVPGGHKISEPEIIYECGRSPGYYRTADWTRLDRVFTVLGSSVTYFQDNSWANYYKVRCTLLERI